jgi:hypothetical protein
MTVLSPQYALVVALQQLLQDDNWCPPAVCSVITNAGGYPLSCLQALEHDAAVRVWIGFALVDTASGLQITDWPAENYPRIQSLTTSDACCVIYQDPEHIAANACGITYCLVEDIFTWEHPILAVITKQPLILLHA